MATAMDTDEGIQLTDEQSAAIDAISSGNNTLITGMAGTGKSTILNHVKSRGMAILATTGVAAVNVGGQTVHSFASLGKGDRSVGHCVGMIHHDDRRVHYLKRLKAIAIDEISMLNASTLELLSEVMKAVRKNPKPFGGLQVCFFGDFLQLMPVSGDFAFESQLWRQSNIQNFMLTQNFRQEDVWFQECLEKMRLGIVDDQVQECLSRCEQNDRHEDAMQVKTHNKDADRVNAEELEKIPGESRVYDAVLRGEDWAKKTLSKNCLAPDHLELKAGARVMLLSNLDTSMGLCNGALGTVQDLGPTPRVNFDCGVTVAVDPTTWEIADNDDKNKVAGTKSQIALRLAYACSVHKTQGMQFDNISVNVAKAFAPGQSYVAMSRCRTIDGLYVEAWKPSSIFADDEAIRFYD